MSFISLPTGKLYKKSEKKDNFSACYIGKFYRNLAENVDFMVELSMIQLFQQKMVKNIFWQLVILPKACKQTLTITWPEIKLTMIVSGRS